MREDIKKRMGIRFNCSTISAGHGIRYIYSGVCSSGICTGSKDPSLALTEKSLAWLPSASVVDSNSIFCYSKEAAVCWDRSNRNDSSRRQRPAL